MSFAIFDMDFISSIDTDLCRLKLLIYFCTEENLVKSVLKTAKFIFVVVVVFLFQLAVKLEL